MIRIFGVFYRSRVGATKRAILSVWLLGHGPTCQWQKYRYKPDASQNIPHELSLGLWCSDGNSKEFESRCELHSRYTSAESAGTASNRELFCGGIGLIVAPEGQVQTPRRPQAHTKLHL